MINVKTTSRKKLLEYLDVYMSCTEHGDSLNQDEIQSFVDRVENYHFKNLKHLVMYLHDLSEEYVTLDGSDTIAKLITY